MLRSTFHILIFIFLLPSLAFGENDPKKKFTRAEYIATWKDVAIRQMQEHGIPASITLAQGILESGDGNSRLARDANNHFGIKCHDWTGQKIYHDDDARNECFRKYRSAQESFVDHSVFLKKTRYAFLFDYAVTDYKSWAKGLKKAGYATNPKYPELLIRIIEENNLTAYDRQGMGKKGAAPVAQKSGKNRGKDEIVVNINRGATVYISDNKIEYVITERAQTPEELAESMNMGRWQIRKYNDLNKGEKITPGTKVYIQPKRNKSASVKTHVVKEGETLHTISQLYGVKMKKILKRSDLPKDYRIKTGDTLKLR